MAAEKSNAALDRAMLIGHMFASQLQGRQRSIADAVVFDLAAKAGTYCFALIRASLEIQVWYCRSFSSIDLVVQKHVFGGLTRNSKRPIYVHSFR